jgi:RNA polymerase sigma factor (sigma-70 family)
VKVIVRDLPAPEPEEEEPEAEEVTPQAIIVPPNQPPKERAAFMRWLDDNWGSYVRGRLFARRGIAEESARDLAQDVLVFVLQQHDGGQVRGGVQHYLDSVIENQILNYRRLSRHKALDHEADADLTADAAPGPESEAELAEQQEIVRRCVARLPLEEREVLEAREREELTLEKTAEKLDRPVSTVAKQHKRAMTRLADLVRAELLASNHRRRAG